MFSVVVPRVHTMCRMVAGLAVGEGLGRLAGLIRLLPRAASSDPYLAAITGGEARHCHGYGFFAALRRRGAWVLSYERFDAADAGLGEEETCRANLEALRAVAERLAQRIEGSEAALVLFHARRAGRREPRGSMNAHPFHEVVELPRRRLEVYVVHNGGIDKERLVEEVGVSHEHYTDTHVFAILLSRYLAMGLSIEDAVEKAKPYVKSALDLGIAIIEPGKDPVLYLNGYLSERISGDEARQAYYEPVLATSEGLVAYVSSTIRDLARDAIAGLRFEKLEGLRRVTLDELP